MNTDVHENLGGLHAVEAGKAGEEISAGLRRGLYIDVQDVEVVGGLADLDVFHVDGNKDSLSTNGVSGGLSENDGRSFERTHFVEDTRTRTERLVDILNLESLDLDQFDEDDILLLGKMAVSQNDEIRLKAGHIRRIIEERGRISSLFPGKKIRLIGDVGEDEISLDTIVGDIRFKGIFADVEDNGRAEE